MSLWVTKHFVDCKIISQFMKLANNNNNEKNNVSLRLHPAPCMSCSLHYFTQSYSWKLCVCPLWRIHRYSPCSNFEQTFFQVVPQSHTIFCLFRWFVVTGCFHRVNIQIQHAAFYGCTILPKRKYLMSSFITYFPVTELLLWHKHWGLD